MKACALPVTLLLSLHRNSKHTGETKMATYKIMETMSKNSIRADEEIQASGLVSAKVQAEDMQYFHGTVMKVADQSGAILAYKEDEKNWVDA
jgi:hypothetical protein